MPKKNHRNLSNQGQRDVRQTLQSLLFLLLASMVGCGSPQRSGSDRSPALSELDQGLCPPDIVDIGGDSFSSQRYGSGATASQLESYRQREIGNCTQAVSKGQHRALQTLVTYWQEQNAPSQVAAIYRLYVDNGRDRDRLAEASATLYQMYSSTTSGVPTNDELAFKYLGLAVRYGVSNYTLTYADALHARSLYKDAFAYYSEVGNGAANGSSSRYSEEQICEVNFKLGDLYFRGRGVPENWYLGYYYWRRAQQQAASPEWGSCIRDNFAYPQRYQLESERHKSAVARIQRLSSREKAEIEDALRKPAYRGLTIVSAIPFTGQHIPVAQRSEPTGPSPKNAPLASTADWGGWTPLSGGICSMRHGTETLPWSDIFELRSPAIWTLNSTVGQDTSLGSAVAVGKTTLITNCHMISNPANISLRQKNNRIAARLISADRGGDRCILAVDRPLPGYVLSARGHTGLRVGEDVAAIGNPKGLDTSLSRGLIAQKRQRSGRAFIQTDAALSSGSSGGGLFDNRGNLIGITTFTIAEGENLNFAIAAEEFCRM